MPDKPISLLPHEVGALIDSRKTQRRSAIHGVPMFSADYDRQWHPHVIPPGGSMPDEWSWWEGPRHGPSMYHWQKLPIKKGDRLWVREKWHVDAKYDQEPASALRLGTRPVWFDAGFFGATANCSVLWGINPPDLDARHKRGRMRIAHHMPRWASRITLIVTDVRVQRLQNITEDDAKAEGVVWRWRQRDEDGDYSSSSRVSPIHAFSQLWDSLHGRRAWDSNPWVMAVTFTPEFSNIDTLEAAA